MIKITKCSSSSLSRIDFDHLIFGQSPSDHMLVCEYKNDTWNTPEIIPYTNFKLSPATHALHYGQTVFEGLKAYKDKSGVAWLFRPEENAKRLNLSAERLGIPKLPDGLFLRGVHTLVDIDSDWIPQKKDASLYIRPFLFSSSEQIQASASKEYIFCIICMPTGKYYDTDLKVIIETVFSRAAKGGIGFAKAGGNYGAQFHPTALAKAKEYDQIIWTDSNEHAYIEESGTMNLFVRIEDTLFTPPISDTILSGVTRKSIIQIAKDQGLGIEEKPIKVRDLIKGIKEKQVKEFFGSGTAVVIQKIQGVSYEGNYYPITVPSPKDSYANLLKRKLQQIQYNEIPDPYGWRVQVGSIL